ncbi:hypothetical protein Y032_0003g1630 [Ancylostoma ceylanicum]|uniref:Uncharacterized protein n=1 Tax=Ancylostoma ceylanicum TaxID=53326 RepID=A0A016VYS8_9BILA|nr:hypothetical protein Y032_0003g1630 [Ancylostoma ceylanicum]
MRRGSHLGNPVVVYDTDCEEPLPSWLEVSSTATIPISCKIGLLRSSTERGRLQDSSLTVRTNKPVPDEKTDAKRKRFQPKPYWVHVGCTPICSACLRVATD